MTDTTGSAPAAGNPPPASAAAALNASPPVDTTAGTSFGDANAAATTEPWFKTAGVDEKYHAGIAAKGWTDPNAVLESYGSLEKVLGLNGSGQADRVLIRPGDKATPEEVSDYLGKALTGHVPTKAEDYALVAPEGLDIPILKDAADWALDAGIPAPMMQALAGKAIAQEQARIAAFEQQSQRDMQDLQGEWGGKFDDQVEVARRGWGALSADLGLKPEQMSQFEQIFGTKAVLKMMNMFGRGALEAPSPGAGVQGAGSGGGFRMTADQAQAKIGELSKDDGFQARYLSPNPAVRNKAIEEMEKLQMVATGTA